jgi:hypothetical protein
LLLSFFLFFKLLFFRLACSFHIHSASRRVSWHDAAFRKTIKSRNNAAFKKTRNIGCFSKQNNHVTRLPFSKKNRNVADFQKKKRPKEAAFENKITQGGCFSKKLARRLI